MLQHCFPDVLVLWRFCSRTPRKPPTMRYPRRNAICTIFRDRCLNVTPESTWRVNRKVEPANLLRRQLDIESSHRCPRLVDGAGTDQRERREWLLQYERERDRCRLYGPAHSE